MLKYLQYILKRNRPLDINGSYRNRSSELTSDKTYGDDINTLVNKAYEASHRVESTEGEYARKPINGHALAVRTANDVENAIIALPRVSEDFQEAVNYAMPYIKGRIEKYVESIVKNDRFCGNGHHVRQHIALNVEDVISLKLGL